MHNLKSLFTQHWIYLAVRTGCKLGVFDAVEGGASTLIELQSKLECNPKALKELISALTHHGFLKNNAGQLSLTELSEPLCESHPKSLKYACLLWGGEHMDVWQNLEETIKTGTPVFQTLFGSSFFNYLDENEPESIEYHKAMYEYARDDYFGIEEVIDLSKSSKCADIGGANGALVHQLSKRYADVQFSIFDRQDRRNTVAQKFEFISGDFFTQIPTLGDAYLLSRVLHDWDDDHAKQILSNCFDSLPNGGVIYIIENDLNRLGDGGHLLSLNMLAVCQSFERTESEYEALLYNAGFRLEEHKNHNSLSIIKAIKP